MSRRRLIASLSAVACGLVAATVLAVTVFPLKAAPRTAAQVQETQAALRGAAPMLGEVRVEYRGFDYATLNDTTSQEQKEYQEKFLKDPPRVGTPYDQEKVDEMKRVISAFWKEKGVEVEVSSTLTPVPNSRQGYARLVFNVQDTQGASAPVVNAKAIWTGKVERGTMNFDVRALGTLVLLDGEPVAKIDMPEVEAGQVRDGDSAEVDTHKGIAKGHVTHMSSQVIEGKRSVMIALDSAVPSGVDANAVEATIRVDALEDIVYVGRPHPGNMSADAQGHTVGVIYKIVDNGKEAEQVHVDFGRASVKTIQVLSGLKPGDTVILSDMSAYRKFDRVEIKQAS